MISCLFNEMAEMLLKRTSSVPRNSVQHVLCLFLSSTISHVKSLRGDEISVSILFYVG